MTIAAAPIPILRTLVPALRGLERELTEWFVTPNRRLPLEHVTKANLEGIRDDFRRRADDLDLEQPLLVVLLMGGTGVGKSSLLNALAGAEIAQASFTRPTTRDPVVYHHRAVNPDRLDPALRSCRLVAHEREELREKIIVDTPDLDSNEEENRQRLLAVLPIADVVLYVGSQEKYHDRVGWDLFRAQRQRRAFAFVLNKWDRCTRPTSGGMRPDQDLLHDLAGEGFQDPLLFRTSAQHWIDRAGGSVNGPPPEGEQFADLLQWLAEGLTRLEIEALKTRGVIQLLDDLLANLNAALPPDVTETAKETGPVWSKLLDEEADELAGELIHALEPHQKEIELHFRLTGQQRFQRLMAGYLGVLNRLQYAGRRIRNPVGSLASVNIDPSRSWDLRGLTRDVMTSASERGIAHRINALGDRLVVAAGSVDFPSDLLAPRIKDLTSLDWKGQLGAAVEEALGTVEREWAEPTGARRILRGGLVMFANFIPELTFVGSVIILLYKLIVVKEQTLSLGSVLIPFVLTLAVLMVFHILIHLLLPMRWTAIRNDFRKHLERAIDNKLETTYLPLPGIVAKDLAAERDRIRQIAESVSELKGMLESRRHAARIDAMYGHSIRGS